jgi:hypothetical protein
MHYKKERETHTQTPPKKDIANKHVTPLISIESITVSGNSLCVLLIVAVQIYVSTMGNA